MTKLSKNIISGHYILSWMEGRLSCLKHVPFFPRLLDENLKLLHYFFRPASFLVMANIVAELKHWEGITCEYHKYGGLEFMYKDKELGHIHGNGLVDILLSQKEKQELVDKGLAFHHHVFPDTGWLSYKINAATEIEAVLDLFERAKDYVDGKTIFKP